MTAVRRKILPLGTLAMALQLAAMPVTTGAQTASPQEIAGELAPEPSGATIYVAREFITLDAARPRVEAGYLERLNAALATHEDKGRTFVTWGYHHYFHGELSRAKLDQLAPDFPVIVWHRSAHEFYLNSAALRKTGIDQAVIDAMPKSAQAQSSLEKGHFYEQGAMAVLGRLSPEFADAESFRRGLEYAEGYYHSNGITLACEPGGFFSKPMQDAINAVYSDDATPFNHCFMADGKTFAARNPKDPEAMIKDSEQVLGWAVGGPGTCRSRSSS